MDRLNILSGNYPITSINNELEVLKGGVFYSNRLVNKAGVFEEFNTFLKKSIYTKKDNFFGNIVRKIPKTEVQNISRICFKKGFVEKKYYEYSDKEMKVIKSCWANKNYKKKNNGK